MMQESAATIQLGLRTLIWFESAQCHSFWNEAHQNEERGKE